MTNRKEINATNHRQSKEKINQNDLIINNNKKNNRKSYQNINFPNYNPPNKPNVFRLQNVCIQ